MGKLYVHYTDVGRSILDSSVYSCHSFFFSPSDETYEGIQPSIANHSFFTHTLLFFLCVCVLAEKNDISKWPKSDEFDSRGWGEGRCSA